MKHHDIWHWAFGREVCNKHYQEKCRDCIKLEIREKNKDLFNSLVNM